jgi:hypothetical protein
VTFSDQKVVDFISREFVAAWESVAPVTVATFKLDAEREVRGVINGEIALYFCRPDGTVFDVMPGLQSPAATLSAMKEALALYQKTGGANRWDEVRSHHARQYLSLSKDKISQLINNLTNQNLKPKPRKGAADPAGEVLLNIAYKGLTVGPVERITTVQLGGYPLLRSLVHQAFSNREPGPPGDWTEHMFEEILEMPLVGGTHHFDTASAEPTSLTLVE